jgi:ubiquinone/menaquinone biosynthesis C-methylase UbiE
LEQGGTGAVLAAGSALASPASEDEVGRRRAAAYDSWFDSAWGRYAFAVEAGTLLHHLGELAGRTLLDVGCGSGRLTALFEAQGARATGLDLDASMLALAGQRFHGRLLRADANRLPIPDRSFDITVAITLLEFVADPALVIAEMARVTRPGGRLAIASLNPVNPWGLAHWRRLREPRGRALVSSAGPSFAAWAPVTVARPCEPRSMRLVLSRAWRRWGPFWKSSAGRFQGGAPSRS